MKTKTAHRLYVIVLLFITAVVLCTLPFLLVKKDIIYVYTKNHQPDSRERGFILELKNLSYQVKVNQTPTKEQETAIWFKMPHNIKNIMFNNKFKYNFVYNEEYYPFDYEGLEELPIILTPYQDLYEHYVRSNIKSAVFFLGVNTREFFSINSKKPHKLVYYEYRNKETSLYEYLSKEANAYYLGRFWNNDISPTASSEVIASKENKILSQAEFVVVDNSNVYNLMPEEMLNAISSGTPVITQKNGYIQQIYGDTLNYIDQPQKIADVLTQYRKNPNEIKNKAFKAQQITLNKLSSTFSAKRFVELLNWLKLHNSL